MNKGACFYFLFIFCFFIIQSISAEIIINEIELNPSGTDSGNEWVELYSEDADFFSGQIMNKGGKNMSINCSFFDTKYCLIITKYQFLSNTNQKLVLIDENGRIIDETETFSDGYDDERSWQLCNDELKFEISTKEKENSCNNEELEEKRPEIKEKKKKNDYLDNIVIKAPKPIEPPEIPIIESNVIKLGNVEHEETIVTGKVVYESKNEIIKKYSLYGFLVLVLGLGLVVIFGKRD